ncbi:DUF1320 family protein [Tenacibaculum maritimum]|nr:DUF1320 family protein [Tenacibaculum maritimum]MDB0611261.1 DUF1320 family protein [Tenacibaculum maritimum]
MFLRKEELGNVIYGYQLDQITEQDDSIVLDAINSATEEMKSYLTGNNKKEWLDGRIQYDVDAIFSAKGEERNPLILTHTKTLTKWYVVELANADVIYEQAKERYDRAKAWLTKLSKGEINLSTLPVKEAIKGGLNTEPFYYGSRNKFKHE